MAEAVRLDPLLSFGKESELGARGRGRVRRGSLLATGDSEWQQETKVRADEDGNRRWETQTRWRWCGAGVAEL